jgi:hypothetical protein
MDSLDDFLRAAASRTWSSPEELNAWMAQQVRQYNARPQAELGGLSPERASRLLTGDWEKEGPLRLNDSLELPQLRHARFLNNARTFLLAVQEWGTVKATATGNLNRAFVREMVERMDLEPEYLRALKASRKNINEDDSTPIHSVRVVLDLAGAIKRRKDHFSLTRKGTDYLPESRAGSLYAHLFRTFFQRLNLAYLDGMAENPALQSTLPVTFYRLVREGRQWSGMSALAEKTLHPAALEQPSRASDAKLAIYQFEIRVVRPLAGFGLLETREVETAWPYLKDLEARTTPLYSQFIRFEF